MELVSSYRPVVNRIPAVGFGGFMAGFGAWLRSERLRADLTLEELADRLGTSHPTISRYENEKSNPKRPTVIRIAETLGADVNEALLSAGFLPDVPLKGLTRSADLSFLQNVEGYNDLDEDSKRAAEEEFEERREVEAEFTVAKWLRKQRKGEAAQND